LEKDLLDSTRSGWNSSDGLMISAPAETLQEALDITNLLMRDSKYSKPLK